MIYSDLHTHTIYCDGKCTPREMIEAAIEKKLPAIGFSAHAYTFFDTSYCIKEEAVAAYLAELRALKEEYRDKIAVYIGFEVDALAKTPTEAVDYRIGSAHYIKVGDRYYDVDLSLEAAKKTVTDVFGGDADAYAEAYYETLATVGCHKPSIIGHFDLVTKYNEKEPLVNTASPRYIAAWQRCADTLLSLGVPFEINTGAMSRGHRTAPYPSKEILTYLKEKGAFFVLSGDAHHKDTIGFAFDRAIDYAKACGITEFCNNTIQFAQK